jgi:hypothetical protein
MLETIMLSIVEMAKKIGSFFKLSDEKINIEILKDSQDYGTAGEPCIIIQKKLVEVIEKNCLNHGLVFNVLDPEEYSEVYILSLTENQAEYKLLSALASICEKIEKESGVQKNMQRILSCVEKNLKKTSVPDVAVTVDNSINGNKILLYKVSISIGSEPPFVFTHESAEILMLVINAGMVNILNTLSGKKESKIIEE